VSEHELNEDLLRELAPQVLAAVLRHHGDFGRCEDAVQEALSAAAIEWPRSGLPDYPRGWLITVASRRVIDGIRSDQARRHREEAAAADQPLVSNEDPALAADDTLLLLFLCCHPALSPSAQVALTLRAVGGLTTAAIASAFLVPEATMAQRIVRAKATVKAAGARFEPPEDRDARLGVVLRVLYLVFNEGYTTSSGPDLQRAELTHLAIRLARMLHALVPDDGEVTGLLALMLLTDARRAARTGPDGDLIALWDQDRGAWDEALIAEGTALIEAALLDRPLGPYQLQAAIAAVHGAAAHERDTDWRQVLDLYGLLDGIAPGPMVTLNRVVAVSMVHGPQSALALLATLDDDDRIKDHHRLYAVRGHLLEDAGKLDAARAAYVEAAQRTTSQTERRYLEQRARRLPER